MFNRVMVVMGMLICLAAAGAASAETKTPPAGFERGQVVSVQKEAGSSGTARVNVLSGPDQGKTVEANNSGLASNVDVLPPSFKPGDKVILQRGSGLDGKQTSYSIVDHYRLPWAGVIFALMLLLAIMFAGWRGIGSLLGLVLSIIVLAGFVIPHTLKTGNPYPATALGVVIISVLGIFIAHGLSRRTALALASTYITIAVAAVMSFVSANLMHLGGVSSENAFYLSQVMPDLNLQGLFVCGMIISMIGILDDITVGQATAVQEIAHANHSLKPAELYARGLKIGREHIASLVNTLVLAYVGTSMLFIAFIIVYTHFPLWITLNSPVVMEQIVRSLVGSITLILAVPISTFLASRYLPKPKHL
jgi:uncharacterized membrane protein